MSETLSDRIRVEPVETAGTSIHAKPRVAVVLAAGRSERLSRVTGGGSKALIRVGGLSLVERAVRSLLAAGLQYVVVIVGYHAGPVAAVVNRIDPARVRAVFAEGWEHGNGASLSAAEPYVAEEELFVLVTMDHLFGEGALTPLLAAVGPSVLVDHAPQPDAWAEGTRVRLHEEQAVAFSKELGDPTIDCGAFLLPRAAFDAQRTAASRGDGSLAGAVTELAAATPLEAVALPQWTWWQDVDTPEDLDRAARRLRASLTKRTDGPVSRFVNRPVSTRLSIGLAHLPLHPDVVSFVAFLVIALGAWALAVGMGILGAALVHTSSILDGVDGELARLRLRAGPRGALLDGVLDRAGDALALVGLALWALQDGVDPTAVVMLAVAATAGSMLSMATKDRIAALGLPPPPERWIGWLMGGRDARLLIITVCALLGSPVVALAALTVTTTVSIAVRLMLVRFVDGSWAGPS